MRPNRHFLSVATLALIAMVLAAGPAASQPKPQQQSQPTGPAPIKPYKVVPITLPAPVKDATFDAFRGQLAAAIKRKERAAIAPLVVSKGFFWDRESGDGADKKKTGADNLAVALGLGNKEGAGWDMLAGYAEDPTASPSAQHKGAICAPADPGFIGKDFGALLDATETDVGEWAFPVADGVEVRTTPQTSAPVAEKLGLHFVRVIQDNSPAAAVASYVRIATPGGKSGYVSADDIAPIGNDQLCYVKDGNSWKIGGYIGAGEAQ